MALSSCLQTLEWDRKRFKDSRLDTYINVLLQRDQLLEALGPRLLQFDCVSRNRIRIATKVFSNGPRSLLFTLTDEDLQM
jgi:hypothetical protein